MSVMDSISVDSTSDEGGETVVIGFTNRAAHQALVGAKFTDYENASCFFWPENLVSFDGIEDDGLLELYGDLLNCLVAKNGKGFLQALLHRRPKKGENLSGPNVDTCIENLQVKYGSDAVQKVSVPGMKIYYLVLRVCNNIDPTGDIRREIREAPVKLMRALIEEESQKGFGDTNLVPEDIFALDEKAMNIKIEKEIPKGFYKGTQSKLGDVLLERAQHVLCNGRPLCDFFDDVAIQIYTTNINMLEGQTRQRIKDPNSEFFSKDVYNDPNLLARLSLDSVKKYNLNSQDVRSQAQRLQREAERKPSKLFLIVADEAHWGIRGQTKKKPPTQSKKNLEEDQISQELEKLSGAYNYLVNTWSKFSKNALIVQVTATPYNLLTENTRIDLERSMPYSQVISHGIVGPASSSKDTGFRRVHHVKWSEGFEDYLQKGLIAVLFCQFKEENRLLHFEKDPSLGDSKLFPWQTQTLQTEGIPRQEFLFEGTLDRVTIKTTDRTHNLVACKQKKIAGFLDTNQLKHKKGKYTHEFFLDVSYGEDALCIFTKDKQFQLHIPEEDQRVLLKRCPIKGLRFPRDPFVEPPQRDELFMVKFKKTLVDLDYGDQYMSLNAYVASTGEQKQFERFLRSDQDFREMKRIVTPKSSQSNLDPPSRHCFILGVDYCYYMLIIHKLREVKLEVNKFQEMISDLSKALGDYTSSKEALVNEFIESLGSTGRRNELIPQDMVVSCIDAIGGIVTETAERILNDYLTTRIDPDINENLRLAKDVLCYILDSCLFASKSKLDDLSKIIGTSCTSSVGGNKVQFLSRAFRKFKQDFESVYKPQRIKENETCRIIDDLALRKHTDILDGKMKVLRIKGGNQKKALANKLFSTMCLARKISSTGSYSFEILRDYDTFKITAVQKCPKEIQERTALFRIRRLFQQRKCEKCPCATSELHEDLKCKKCGHLHKTVESYEDLDKLPLLLIVVNKGRMGDTFPPSFNFMDMRLTSDISHLSTFVQELGRLCRYTNKEDISNIPYALLTENVEKMLTNARLRHGTYHAISLFSKGKSPYVTKENFATDDSMDYKNHTRDSNRILFEAETQIGKTGVYLNFCSKVRKAIKEVNVHTDSTDEESSADESDEVEKIDSMNEDVTERESDRKVKWMRPYWQKMEKAKPLLKSIPNGKYCKIYGSYEYGKTPNYCVSKRLKGKHTPVRKAGKPDENSTHWRSHRMSHWDKCQKCKELQQTTFVKKIFVGGEIEISVPKIIRMKKVIETLEKGRYEEDTNAVDDDTTLRTWIFTPSFRRHDQAYLNLKHTMLADGDRPVSYVQVVVVRIEEFQSYVQTWGGSHVVLCLPDSLPEHGSVTPEIGGVGYARLFIQLFAKEYELKTIFVLDDNILTSRQIQFSTEKGQEMVERTDGRCIRHRPVPLFKVLKDLEDHFFNKNDPAPMRAHEFQASPDVPSFGTQESFTGPWSKYGLLGVLKNRGTNVCVRQAFIKTHVHSLVLLNIEALGEKGILYKPMKVWEDLDINNQSDDKGLWVVKYCKWNISKASMRDWLPDVYHWDEKTKVVKPIHSIYDPKSQCKKMITDYIKKYFPIRHVINMPSSPDADVEQISDSAISYVAKSVKTHQSSPFILLTFHDGTFGFELNAVSIIKQHLSMSGNLLMLLPASVASVCEEYDRRTKTALLNYLEDSTLLTMMALPREIELEVITSGNVADVSVSLILITLVTPGEPNIKGLIENERPERTPRELGTSDTRTKVIMSECTQHSPQHLPETSMETFSRASVSATAASASSSSGTSIQSNGEPAPDINIPPNIKTEPKKEIVNSPIKSKWKMNQKITDFFPSTPSKKRPRSLEDEILPEEAKDTWTQSINESNESMKALAYSKFLKYALNNERFEDWALQLEPLPESLTDLPGFRTDLLEMRKNHAREIMNLAVQHLQVKAEKKQETANDLQAKTRSLTEEQLGEAASKSVLTSAQNQWEIDTNSAKSTENEHLKKRRRKLKTAHSESSEIIDPAAKLISKRYPGRPRRTLGGPSTRGRGHRHAPY